MSAIKGVKTPSYKNDVNILKFVDSVCLGLTVTEICEIIGFKRQTYYQWLDDKNIMSQIDKRVSKIHTEGQAFIKARYMKYLSSIDKLCDDTTDKRTCLSANVYMIDRMDGKAGSSMDVTVAEVSDGADITSAKDLLSKYNKHLTDLATDTIEEEE